MSNTKHKLFKNADCVSSCESSSSSSTVASLSSIPSRFSLFSTYQQTHQSPKRRNLLIPSCLSRQDSNPSDTPCPRRAVTPDMCQPMVRSLESGRSLKLTEDDVDLIRSTWQRIQDKQLWCQRLFMKIYSQNEQIKKVMGYECMQIKELLQCGRFESHCSRFIDFWQRLIDILSCADEDQDVDQRALKLVNKIRQVGYMHAQMPGVTFDAESWLLFKNVILESVYLQQCDIRERRHFCWSKFVTFVISEMKDAFHQGVRSRSHTF